MQYLQKKIIDLSKSASRIWQPLAKLRVTFDFKLLIVNVNLCFKDSKRVSEKSSINFWCIAKKTIKF